MEKSIDSVEEEEVCYTFAELPPVTLRQQFADCSNVFKGFIGSAMVGLPFAASQSGIGFLLIGTFIIAILTDYGCVLIVKCKQLLIDKALKDLQQEGAIDASVLREKEAVLGRSMSFGEIAKLCLGPAGVYLTNTALMVTQFGFSIGYFIFFGNTMRSIVKHFVGGWNGTATGGIEPSTGYIVPNSRLTNTTTTPVSSSFTGLDASSLLVSIINAQFFDSSVGFTVFLAVPLPLLVLISFVRDVRKVGPISVIANTSIVASFAATLTFMLVGIHSIPHITWFNIKAFPILFGQVTAAFEGIGTVLSIESSMGENRSKYPTFLHLSVMGCVLVLTSFGSVGYLRFGNLTCQLVTTNLRGVMAIVLQCLLFVGILFTYPLQIYPCIQITEAIIHKTRLLWRQRIVYRQLNDNVLGAEENLEDEVNCNLKTWEGNIIRMLLVSFTAAIALVFRFQFVYIAALTGAIGSSVLSYIIPALCHIRLIDRGRWGLWAMDIFLIIFG